MKHDQTGLIALAGSGVAASLSNLAVTDVLSGTLSLVGIGYTLWKWRRESRKSARR